MLRLIEKLFGHVKTSRNRRKPHVRLGLESLEQRQLLAVTVSINSGGDLVLKGNNRDDVVSVSDYVSGGVAYHKIVNNGLTQYVRQSLVTGGDVIFDGQGGNDRFSSTSSSLRVAAYGGAGNDYLTGGPLADRIYGGDGNDSLNGAVGNDILYGDAGADSLVDYYGDDQLFGGAGNDKLDGGANNDTLNGGDGNDELLGGSGRDRLFGELGNDLLDGGNDNDMLNGGDGDDELLGGYGDDSLYGEAGWDWLDGQAGRDYISGGTGVDFLWGGSEADVFVAAYDDNAYSPNGFRSPHGFFASRPGQQDASAQQGDLTVLYI